MSSTSSSSSDAPPRVTVAAVLTAAARRIPEGASETPRLDAEVLLAHLLRVDRATLLASRDVPIAQETAITFDALVERRARGEPVAYIRGLKEFYGLAFGVDPRALIPRPETETLVDLALARVGTMLASSPRPPGTRALEILDVGTGSGAIAVTLAVEARRRGWASELRISASDASPEALALALENAVVHGVADAVDFAEADLAAARTRVDLLLANLPYISSDALERLPIAASFEPRAALDGGPDGLEPIRRLVRQIPDVLDSNGIVLLEIGADQGDPVATLVADEIGPGWAVVVNPDLGGRPRVVEIRYAR